MKTAIIIDSSSGLKDLKNYPDVYLSPLIIINSEGETIKDDENLSSDKFYQMNDTDILKTSQTIVGDMYKLWDELIKKYDNIICLLISKGLSGQFSTYKMLCNEEKYVNRVFVVDTNGVSLIIKRQVEIVQSLIQQGKTPNEICEIIQERYANNVGYIIPKSLTQLVRGGRISRAAASLAKFLRITPILRYDGTIDKEDKTRTFKKAITMALEKIKSTNSGDFVIDVAWSRADQNLLDEVLELIKMAGLKLGIVEEMPNVIVCHTGRETFALIPYFI